MEQMARHLVVQEAVELRNPACGEVPTIVLWLILLGLRCNCMGRNRRLAHVSRLVLEGGQQEVEELQRRFY